MLTPNKVERAVRRKHRVVLVSNVSDVVHLEIAGKATHAVHTQHKVRATVEVVGTLVERFAMSVALTIVIQTQRNLSLSLEGGTDQFILLRIHVVRDVLGGLVQTKRPDVHLVLAVRPVGRATSIEPCPSTRVANPPHKRAVLVIVPLTHHRIMLNSLSTHGVASKDDLVKIGVLALVKKHINHLVNHGEI